MMPTNNAKRDEVRKIILSLLLARPGATAVTVLDNDYYDVENERIPWRKFGYANIVEFLQSMPENFVVERHNGIHYVHGIASEKSKHVSSLVSRQKTMPKRYIPPNRYRPSYYTPHVRHRIRIPAEQLNILAQYVKDYPNGISIQSALLMLQKQLPHVMLSMHDIQDQLRELAHQLYLDGEMIRPVQNYSDANGVRREAAASHSPSATTKSQDDSAARPSASTVVYDVGGNESDVTDNNENESNAVPDGFVKHRLRRPKTDERFSMNPQHRQQTTFNQRDNNDDIEFSVDTEMNEWIEKNDISTLISDRVRSRLKQLVQKHEDGIWCTELPEKYLKEYKVPLNYTDLGFSSVREYASYLPDIFYMMRQDTKGDFILYSATKRPINRETPEKQSEEVSKTEPIDVPGSHETPSEDDDDDDRAPFPADISPSICATFMPDGVMSYGDSVNQILVTDLQNGKKQFQEVYIVEVFNPSFFWIQLRGNKRHLEIFMAELQTFYGQNNNNYAIPKIALKRGLNCACVYSGLWHRGIIKTVKPDFRVTVMFYDYGTQKTYAPQDLYYLHKQFSYLPAQAIPCGLYNVRPYVGDRWKKSITDRFLDRVCDSLLAATIVSVDPPNNSMMIILTDTSEEEDVHINDWLTRENLARRGKMVRILTYPSLSFRHYVHCNNVTFAETAEAESVRINVDEARHDSDRALSSCDKKVSNVESESIENVEALRKISSRKKATMNTSLNANSRSGNDRSPSETPRGPKKLLMLLERLKASSAAINGKDLRDDTRSVKDSDTKINATESRNYVDHNWLDFGRRPMKFNVRNSDEEIDEIDFGMFQSLYGGHGMMEPLDWAAIKESDSSQMVASSNASNNLDPSEICENDNRAKDNKFVKFDNFFHNEKNETVVKQCFLNVTRKEDEYFLTDSNIDYIKNVSQSVTKLKNRMKICSDKSTMLVVKREILDTLRGTAHSPNTSNINANIVENDGAASLPKTHQETIYELNDENQSSEVCETKVDLETEKREKSDTNASANVESASSNVNSNIGNEARNVSELSAKNAGARAPKDKTIEIFNPRYKMLLEQMKRMQQSLDSSFGTKDSANSEQIQSSYSTRSRTSTETISSEDELYERFAGRNNVTARFNKLRSFVSTHASASSSEIKADPETERDDSAFRTSSVTEFSKQHRPTADTQPSKMLQQVLKMQKNIESVTELDSDDLSSDESNDKFDKNDESVNRSINATNDGSFDNSDKSDDRSIDAPNDESCDENKLDNSSIDTSVVCDLTSNGDAYIPEETIAPPVFQDCYTDSDESEWDVCAEPEHFFHLPQTKVQITEISKDESESMKCSLQNNLMSL